nr:hypothetical protein [Streptomyces sp. NWU339]
MPPIEGAGRSRRSRRAGHDSPLGGEENDLRSANDERQERAERLKRPKVGGVTASGLPRRVPKADPVEGAAEHTPQGGRPLVIDKPDDHSDPKATGST